MIVLLMCVVYTTLSATRRATTIIALHLGLAILGITLRIVAIVVTHRLQHLDIDLNIAIGQRTNIIHDSLVVGMLVLELIVLGTHKAGYATYLLLDILAGAILLGDGLDNLLGILAIVLEADIGLGVAQLLWRHGKVLA